MQKLVIFDLDGTLLDTIEDLGYAVDGALGKNGLPTHSIDEYYAMVGGGVRNLVKRALPENLKEDESIIDKVLADFFVLYRASIDKHTKPYPGINDLLAKLQSEGYLLAVASNKFHEGVTALISKFFPGINFISVLGNRPGSPLKPSPLIIDEITGQCGEPVSAVIIGDSGIDIDTARAAGLPVIAVSWGFRKRSELTKADVIVDSSSELHEAISSSLQ